MRCSGVFAFIGIWALAIPAHAQVTNYYVLGDEYWNTGAGSQALGYELAYETSEGVCETPGGASYACGLDNTAVGQQAAFYNETGSGNTAVGTLALSVNVSGNYNTAIGYYSLAANTASDNTASGYGALYSNTTGEYNTASGYEALYSNTKGTYNTASGYYALRYNSTGTENSATGVNALYENRTGNFNTASGTDALFSNTTGSSNIAAGYKAGYSLTTGSNNIDIGNLGVAAESGTIRIGTTSTQTATYIAGIYGTSVTGNAVFVSSTGQLGVTVSSERYKTDITPMAAKSDNLRRLRPVTFHLKTDPRGSLQYGLIAEEVAKVYPELVIRDQTGQIDGVRYDELAPMLLNEVQQQRSKLTVQAAQLAAQAEHVAIQAQQIAVERAQLRDVLQELAELKDLNRATQIALRKLQGKNELVAQR